MTYSFSAGELTFPSKLESGSAAATSKLKVHVNGPAWQILEAEQGGRYVATSLKEIHRDSSGADYEVAATLNKDIPAGKWQTEILLKTNQPGLPKIRIPLSVEIEPKLLQTLTAGEIKGR